MFKNKNSTFTANLKVRPWYLTSSFPLNVFRGLYISHFIRPSLAYLKLPLSRPKRILGNPGIRRAKNSPTFHFIVFFISVEPPSTTSEISIPLNFLLLQTRPNCIGRSWNLSTKRPDKRLHSGPPYLLHSIVWRLSRRETTSHLCFHSEAYLYPQPSLRMPDWRLLQKKMARKNTYNAINLLIVYSKQQTSSTSRDNLDRAHSILKRRIFLKHLHIWRN